jgi:hypothetical protein
MLDEIINSVGNAVFQTPWKDGRILSELGGIATAGALFFAMWQYRKKVKEDILQTTKILNMELEQMETQRKKLKEAMSQNSCQLYFHMPIRLGCSPHTWQRSKSILWKEVLQKNQVVTLDEYDSLVCEIDDHLKRCRDDFYHRSLQPEFAQDPTSDDMCTKSFFFEHIRNIVNDLPNLDDVRTSLSKYIDENDSSRKAGS